MLSLLCASQHLPSGADIWEARGHCWVAEFPTEFLPGKVTVMDASLKLLWMLLSVAVLVVAAGFAAQHLVHG